MKETTQFFDPEIPVSPSVLMTPALAEKWLSIYRYVRQRPICPKHVKFLADEMRAGRFIPRTLYVCWFHQFGFLTDGYHRLSAILESGLSIEFPVHHRRVNSMEEVTDDYIRHDRGRRRTTGQLDIAANMPSRTGLNLHQLSLFGSALQLLFSGLDANARGYQTSDQKSIDMQIRAKLDYAPQAQAYFEAIHGAFPTIRPVLYRAPVIAMGLICFRQQAALAETFWSAVARNECLSKGTPEYALFYYFSCLNPQVQQSLGRRAVLEVTPAYLARAVANAWNASYRKRALNKLNVTEKQLESPLTVAGTCYTGKAHMVLSYD